MYQRPARSGGRSNGRQDWRPRSSQRSGSRKRQPSKQRIHPSKFIRAARPVAEIAYEPIHQFSDFAVNDLLKTNIAAKGYVMPSEIQDQSIQHVLDGKDVVGIANTGTGKTAAFALPVLHRLMNDPTAKALIIAPTRELAQQIEAECHSFAKKSGLYAALLIGGANMMPQIRELRANPQLVIGTPGRIKDHVERANLNLGEFNVVVLDEMDRMLDMGFIDDIRYLVDQLGRPRQSLFFSATMEKTIEQLIQTFLNEPVTISVRHGDTSDNVTQDVVPYKDGHEKIEKLHDLLNQEEVAKVLVFDETQRDVERLAQTLETRGFRVDALHGGKTQGQRQRALKRFRNNDVTILVATDVAARGIDIVDITHVVNYSTPQTYEDYVHRIGRAGRAGRVGNALTFVSLFDYRF
jgi:ATP-dependent RNA helicase RhlE